MIRSHRRIDCPALDAHHDTIVWMDAHVRAQLTTTARIVCDDALRPRSSEHGAATERATVRAILAGRMWIRTGARVLALGAGDGVVLPPGSATLVRSEGVEHQSLMLEWPHGSEIRGVSRFVVSDLDGLQARVARMRGVPDRDALAAILSSLPLGRPMVERFRLDAGAPKTCEERDQQLSDALDAALSSLAAQPMTTDLESRLGIGSRQLTRRLAAFHALYRSCATGWIEARNERRRAMAAAMLTAPSASVAAVAQLIGYRSPETLARAFALAGLPRPSRVRAHVAALGAAWRARAADASAATLPRASTG